MTGCCGGMGQSEKPEGRCHGMGIPAKEVIGKLREGIEKFKATLNCPNHGVPGIQALGEPLDEALIYNLRQPVSLGQLKVFFKEALLKCPDADCVYHKRAWRCPQCRLWTVTELIKGDGPAWLCEGCFLVIRFPAY